MTDHSDAAQRQERTLRWIVQRCKDALIPGDAVRDRDGLIGVVMGVESISADPWSLEDGTFTEGVFGFRHLGALPRFDQHCFVRLRMFDGHGDRHIAAPKLQLASIRDPYRRFCRIVQAADDVYRQGWRAYRKLHRQRSSRVLWWQSQHLLPAQLWDRLYWQLCNRKRIVGGQSYWADLGRAHWWLAAVECLRRRDEMRERLPPCDP